MFVSSRVFNCLTLLFVVFPSVQVVSSNTSHLDTHAGFFRLLMKGILDPYVL
jgi:hypothetical protein